MRKMKNLRMMVLFEIDMANVNGDPTTGEPRKCPDGHIMVSDACLKNKIRQALYRHEENVLHYENGDKKSVREKVEYLWNEEKKAYDNVKINKEFIDNRLLGATDLYGDLRIVTKGAVTVSNAKSIDPVKLLPVSVNRSYIIDKDEKGKEVSKGFNNTKLIVSYALCSFFVGVDYFSAERNGVTEDDLDKFVYAVRTMFMDDYSVSRPAGSINIRKIIVVKWDGRAEDGVADVAIKDALLLGIKRNKELITSYYDYEFDLSRFEGEKFRHVDINVLEGDEMMI